MAYPFGERPSTGERPPEVGLDPAVVIEQDGVIYRVTEKTLANKLKRRQPRATFAAMLEAAQQNWGDNPQDPEVNR